MPVPFNGKVVEHLALKRIRLNDEEREVNHLPRAAGSTHRSVEPVAVSLRLIRLKVTIRPIGIESGGELVEDVRAGDSRSTNVPLESVDECGMGKIRRPDPGGVESGVALEQPSLGMQAG